GARLRDCGKRGWKAPIIAGAHQSLALAPLRAPVRIASARRREAETFWRLDRRTPPQAIKMGVRIQAYAVDVPRFEEFVAQPIGDILEYVVAHSTDPHRRPVWLHPEDGYIWVAPAVGVFRMRQGRGEILPAVADRKSPFL